MDRRGRGSSSDAGTPSLSREYADVAVVAAALASDQGGPVDVADHSIGATCGGASCSTSHPDRRQRATTGPSESPPWWQAARPAVPAGSSSPCRCSSALLAPMGKPDHPRTRHRPARGNRDRTSRHRARGPRYSATWSSRRYSASSATKRPAIDQPAQRDDRPNFAQAARASGPYTHHRKPNWRPTE